jgi:ElaB/YqjD/DUF883 family membrane-anchored ribosome-binding protein
MPATTDFRKYGETLREQSKTAIEEARKPLFAAVGATNYAFDQLRTQLREWPSDTQARVKKLSDDAQAQLRQLRERSSGVKLDPAQVRKAFEDAAEQARDRYETFTSRGEKIVEQLRRDPKVKHLFGDAEQAVREAEEVVTGEPAQAPAPKATKTTARRAPAKKTTAKS